MQKFKAIGKLSSLKFKRLTGVQKSAFLKMIAIVKEAENTRVSRRGKPAHLTIEDRILLKRFKILSDKYRNRRKRFGLRFNLIAGIQNWELKYGDRC